MSKSIKEQNLNIKKKTTGERENLTIFLSSDNFAFKISLKFGEIKPN